MKSVRSFVAIALATTALCAPVEPRALAQTPPSQYFPQTGLTVRSDFLQFFNTHGGLEIFGYPLTVEFVQGGQLVQYFQRARMEARPAGPDPVRLGSLATELGYGAPSISENIRSINDPNRRYFRETGHTVAYSFLQYFDAHGSLDIFGYPITEFQWENGRLVQYFQRARMEWHPEFPENQRVQLGNLGEIYATTRLDPSVLRPDPALAVPDAQRIASLRATAFLRWAVTRPTGGRALSVRRPQHDACGHQRRRLHAGNVRSRPARSRAIGRRRGERFLGGAGRRDADFVLCVVVTRATCSHQHARAGSPAGRDFLSWGKQPGLPVSDRRGTLRAWHANRFRSQLDSERTASR
jgi:hypothetical protein